MTFDRHTELQLLEALEEEPETSQADLAARDGVAVGTANCYMKRWSKKGYVIVKRIDRWRWRYLLTPQGMAEKTVLARQYVEASMSIYRNTRTKAQTLLGQVQDAGYDEVIIAGDGEIVDICRLTCLELGLQSKTADGELEVAADSRPVLKVEGMDLVLIWPEIESEHRTEPPDVEQGRLISN